MNDAMIAELNQAIEAAVQDPQVRVIIMAGRGAAFCSGGDLQWMKTARNMSASDANRDSGHLARVMQRLYESPKPTVARVHGSSYAGAMGLVSACDIAIASEETRFCLSEVKLGLVPAMISPYVIRAIGERQARRLMLTAEVFAAPKAQAIGLVHESVPADQLDARVGELVAQLLLAGPRALGETKRLIRDVVFQPIDDALSAETAKRISAARASDEGQEGISAFFEKRKPEWVTNRRVDKP
ncbi:MAG: enoyl-CoA hydratase-related protein [Burkholderiaceae bacterium]